MKLDEQAELPVVFRELLRLHRCRLQQVLNQYGLYMGQPMILFALEEMPDATQRQLAEALYISSATITTSLQRMERAALITRTGDPKDTRCKHISLTEKGREVARSCHAAFAQINETLFGGFTEEEQAVLRGYCLRTIRRLEKSNGE